MKLIRIVLKINKNFHGLNVSKNKLSISFIFITDIESNEYKDDTDQALSAGIAEGYLTSTFILQYHRGR